ncbi:MAG: primase [Solirubrobacterales bacterium]|jgi:DNA primase|nr:primase [Solirubrobacterales bacterium]
MARFSSESIERVRDAVDIAEVLAPYTELKRAGQRLQGLCPFHDERTPSFSVNPQDKLYYCFGCGEKGDVFTFLQEKEGLPFAEAVETLADRFGVEVEREQEDPRLEESRKRRARLAELLDRTASYYTKYLWESDEAEKAREYLLGRGLSEESLREFGVGFAPNRWDTVVMRGQQGGYSQAELAAAGLVKKGQKGGWMDHFRARIMFPIRDSRGRMQGFGGRATRKEQRAKYVNSPDGELFHKSRTLYAIEKARGAMAKKGRAVVVEGYTDVIAAHQAGVEETVAIMGTAITPDQVKLLAAHTGEVVLALDADRAGREAMLRAQGVAAGKKVRLRVAAMPEGEDPADMLGGEGPGSSAAERFEKLVEDAVDLSVFHVGTLLDDADLATPDGRDRALDEVVPVLKAMPDSITRDELVRDVGERLGADPGLVARRLAAAPRTPRLAPVSAPAEVDDEGGEASPFAPTDTAETPRVLSTQERREAGLLRMCIADPAHGRDYIAKLKREHLSTPAMGRVRDWLAEHLDEPMKELPEGDDELALIVSRLVERAADEPASPEAMELSFLQLEQGAIERRIAEAAATGATEASVELQKRRSALTEQIAHHQSAVPKQPARR